ncbi:protein transporter [Macrolepiota fuliginosa MF-IS2]|uniref:Mitochondrial import inner membrane translocase subunit TIM16 n=1 Tax=Macrolepiota fuliginosa MF-IS2 TaxID=1400762 RepID=A0A9P5XNH0_9AGAR|nr:protein transporter [Macrolepiota fuliginosa MF-IS2]
MSSPRAIVQIFVTGSRILGKAFYEAGRQAVKNAKNSPQAAMGGDVAGVGHATSGSATDNLTLQHRMTVDEAQLILNVKRGEEMEQILKNYEHLFKANSPPEPKPAEKPAAGKQVLPAHSHYLQSKVVRARERLEAEFKVPEPAAEATEPPTAQPGTQSPPGGSSNAQS